MGAWFMLAFLVIVAVFTLIAYGIGRWISSYVQGHISGRLDELDCIVNQEGVPEPWLKPYRRRAARLIASGASEQRIRRLELAARKKCLSSLEKLQRFATETGIAGSVETKQVIVGTLEEQAARWRDDTTWHALVNLAKPAPVSMAEARDPDQDTNGDGREGTNGRNGD